MNPLHPKYYNRIIPPICYHLPTNQSHSIELIDPSSFQKSVVLHMPILLFVFICSFARVLSADKFILTISVQKQSSLHSSSSSSWDRLFNQWTKMISLSTPTFKFSNGWDSVNGSRILPSMTKNPLKISTLLSPESLLIAKQFLTLTNVSMLYILNWACSNFEISLWQTNSLKYWSSFSRVTLKEICFESWSWHFTVIAHGSGWDVHSWTKFLNSSEFLIASGSLLSK